MEKKYLLELVHKNKWNAHADRDRIEFCQSFVHFWPLGIVCQIDGYVNIGLWSDFICCWIIGI